MKLSISTAELVDKGDVGIVYVLELHLEDKVLVKIGITKRRIKDRVLEILDAIHSKYRYYPHCKQLRFKTVNDPRSVESSLHEYFTRYSYTTEHKWGGSTELFDVDKEIVKAAYDRLLEEGTLDEDYYGYRDDVGLTDEVAGSI
jgi:hypothetical protein